jgi:hypothetical protein
MVRGEGECAHMLCHSRRGSIICLETRQNLRKEIPQRPYDHAGINEWWARQWSVFYAAVHSCCSCHVCNSICKRCLHSDLPRQRECIVNLNNVVARNDRVKMHVLFDGLSPSCAYCVVLFYRDSRSC